MVVEVHIYYTSFVLRYRNVDSCNVSALGCHMEFKCLNFKCIDAAVTCGRDVIDISKPQRNCGVV